MKEKKGSLQAFLANMTAAIESEGSLRISKGSFAHLKYVVTID